MNETILLVDDDPNSLSVLFHHLETLGYRVLVTNSGTNAVEQAVQSQPDLILLDIMMSGMDGYETCQVLKLNAETSHIPVIFLSILTEATDRLKGFEVGAVDYINKPFHIPEITARVQAHLALAYVQNELVKTNEQLEELVEERTARLQAEIEQRKQQQFEKESLLRFLHEQNQQLYQFTGQLLQARPATQVMVSQMISQQLLNNLVNISDDLEVAKKMLNSKPIAVGAIRQYVQAALLRNQQLQFYLQNLDAVGSSPLSNGATSILENLTSREVEVLRLLADGKSSSQIGIQLQIAEVTVRTYRSNIMRKLEIEHLPGLVKYAIRHNLTPLV